MNGLLIKWLDSFKSRFQSLPEAQPTISRIEEALDMYKKEILTKIYQVEMARAIEDRSVLEYGLEWHLPKFIEAVRF